MGFKIFGEYSFEVCFAETIGPGMTRENMSACSLATQQDREYELKVKLVAERNQLGLSLLIQPERRHVI